MTRIFSIAAAAALAAACGPENPGGGESCGAALLAGDLVITEIMANPEGQDQGNEWIEIFNATSAPIDLSGLAVLASRDDGDGERSHTMRPITIGPGQYLVLGGILDEFKPAWVDYGYANDLSALRNSDGRIALRCRSTVVDEAFYATTTSGRSLELDGSQAPDHLRNDEAANFCNATAAYDANNFGTPQESNGFCTIIVPGVCNDGGEARDTVPPGVGDVVITELMPDPNGADGDKEWVEILALAEFDLNGLNIGLEPGSPRAAIDSPDCILVGPGTHILFAKSDDPLLNAGLPQPDAIFRFNLKQGTTSTGDGQLVVGIGDQPLDIVTWTESTQGASLNLNPDLFDPEANDDPASFCAGITPYGEEGNLGTPRAENTGCAAEGQCIDEGTGMARDIVPASDVRITEVMTRTNGETDGNKRWFEVQFVEAGDLNELEMGREGTNNFSTVQSPNCIPIAAGGHAILARSANLELTGLPRFDGLFNFTLVISPQEDLFVGFGGVVLDSVRYPNTPAGDQGTSQQRDDDDAFCTSASASAGTYGEEGNIGTPGAASMPCP